MIRNSLSIMRSTLNSLSRRAINFLGLSDGNDDGNVSIGRRIFDILQRKFGVYTRYVFFISLILLFFTLAFISTSIEDLVNAPIQIISSSTNTNTANNNNNNNNLQTAHKTTNNSSVNTFNFWLSMLLTVISWFALLNLFRYFRQVALAHSGMMPNNDRRQVNSEFLNQLILSNRTNGNFANRLRMALLQRDFNGDDYEMLQQLDNGTVSTGHQTATDNEINRLPLHTVTEAEINDRSSSLSNNDINPSCNICLGPYEIGDEVRTILCMHKFHKNCIDQWLRTNAVCPICKFSAI